MYQVLARKYRPKNFSELVGQTHVSRALGSALERGRLHHAYLFTGTRGVGKTTIARILSKCLNCETGITATPCGVCSVCKSIDEGRFVDLIEIDAASRTKVEDTRELLDNVPYAPTQGRYKVYLIDEVHMLSTSSFNALLKTLEEPPEHVKFLLATTDPQKLPITVLSRCLQFTLRPLPRLEIHHHLADILTREQIAFDDASLWLLAESAQGSVRDALSLTDQAIAYGQGSVSGKDVQEMLGLLNKNQVAQLLLAIHAQDGAGVSQILQDLKGQAVDLKAVLDQLVSLLHAIAVSQHLPHLPYEGTPEEQEMLKHLASRINPQDLQLYYQIAIQSRADLRLAVSPQQGFDMCVLRLLAFNPLPIDQIVHQPPAIDLPNADTAQKKNNIASEITDIAPRAMPVDVSIEQESTTVATAIETIVSPVVEAIVDAPVKAITETPVDAFSIAPAEDILEKTASPAVVVLEATFETEAITFPLPSDAPTPVISASTVETHIEIDVVADIVTAGQMAKMLVDDIDVQSPQQTEYETEIIIDAFPITDHITKSFEEPIIDAPEPLPMDAFITDDSGSITVESDVMADEAFLFEAPISAFAENNEEAKRILEPISPTQSVAKVNTVKPLLSLDVSTIGDDHRHPHEVLAHTSIALEGIWTVEKWDCWLREADITPAVLNLGQHGLMQGAIGAEMQFIIAAEHQLLAKEMFEGLKQAIMASWKNAQISLVFAEASDSPAVTPLGLKNKRYEQALARAHTLVAGDPKVLPLLNMFDAQITRLELIVE